MENTVRAFIAIELDAVIQAQLGGVIRDLINCAPPKVKWSPEKNMHLTLKFLGDVQTWEVITLQQMIRNCANQSKSFRTNLTRLGAFPSVNNPRVVWVGLSDNGDLTRLARTIEEGSRKIGFDAEEKGFTPHLTLGRVKPDITPQERSNLSACINSTPLPSFSPILIQSITLFQSTLKPGGAEYTALSTSRFNH
jgi:2'-5' RNA ligase